MKTKNLLVNHDSEDDPTPDDEPLWLVVTTKQHIVDKARLKPGKITIPHSLNASPTANVCLIVADPQRPYKDLITHPSFPKSLASRVTRVIGISKIKNRYKSFESRRQLLREHDVFLADDRIITRLPEMLGKVFYKGAKRPLPVRLLPYALKKDPVDKRTKILKNPEVKAIALPQHCAREIEKALSCTHVRISPATTTSIRVALSSFIAEQVADNIETVVNALAEKFVTKGWRNLKAIHLKGPNTMAIPIWMADELWVEEKDILESEEVKLIEGKEQKKGNKRKALGSGESGGGKKKTKRLQDSDFGQETAERRMRLRQQKEEARTDSNGATLMKGPANAKRSESEIWEVKTKKVEVIAASA